MRKRPVRNVFIWVYILSGNGEVWPFPLVLETREQWFKSIFPDQFWQTCLEKRTGVGSESDRDKSLLQDKGPNIFDRVEGHQGSRKR